ncbi:MAG: hypothetical protein IPP22_16785 [Nitrosomonas sp.]|nr:hypothetical protein [Nitrosomonas sp.]
MLAGCEEKYARVARHYTIGSEKHPQQSCRRLHFERTNVAAKEYASVYCLRTNMLDWDAGKLWRTYIMLTDLEAVFPRPEIGIRHAPVTIKRPNAWKVTCGSHCLPITCVHHPFAFKSCGYP